MAEEIGTKKVEGGYTLGIGGRTLIFLRGEEGSLVAEAVAESGLSDDKQKCFEECFAKTDGSLGSAKACSKKCGLE